MNGADSRREVDAGLSWRHVVRSGPSVVRGNGIELAYDSYGSPHAPVFLFIMGFAQSRLELDDEFCMRIAAHGLRVIRFDNRDVGLSEKLDACGLP